jgi:hypothetical protein
MPGRRAEPVAASPPFRLPSTGAPHLGQKAKSGAHRYPQPAHSFGCFIPQAGQKAKPDCISAPQPAQLIFQHLDAFVETRFQNREA